GCQWSLSPPALTLANRQTSAGNTMTLRRASVLKIHIQDPNRQLAQKTRDGRRPHLLIGVPTPRGALAPARLARQDAAGADFEVTVPFDTRLTLHVVSRGLKLGDDRASPLAGNAARQSFQQASADPNP